MTHNQRVAHYFFIEYRLFTISGHHQNHADILMFFFERMTITSHRPKFGVT